MEKSNKTSKYRLEVVFVFMSKIINIRCIIYKWSDDQLNLVELQSNTF